MAGRPRALPLVASGEELDGVAPVAFERAARRATPGDSVHRGLVRVALTIAAHAVQRCVAPGGRGPLHAALQVAEQWADGAASEAAVKKARSEAFAASVAAERLTVSAIAELLGAAATKRHTAIDVHADSTVTRHVGLGAYYATSAVLCALDGVSEPKTLCHALPQAAGAIAYHLTALGPARSQELRSRALEQASWEAERPFAPAHHPAEAIALQLFHEYLGAGWKDRSDGLRLGFAELAEWALPPQLRAS